jgi:hypothetical protein
MPVNAKQKIAAMSPGQQQMIASKKWGIALWLDASKK